MSASCGTEACATPGLQPGGAMNRHVARTMARLLWIRAVAELRLPELTATAIVTDVERWSPYRAEVVADAGPVSPTDASYWQSLRERGYGAALDVRLVKVGFAGRGGSDPGIRLILSAEARLVETATGAPTALRGLVYLSPPHDETGWTRDGGALMKTEIERAYRTLAERMVDSLVLRTEIFVGFDAPPPPYTCGVEPTRPKLEWEGVLFGVRHPATAVVQSLNPVLAWEGVPAPMSIVDALYYSRNEGETAKPVPCTLKDLTPCGCLDFIPRHNLFRFRTP